MLLAYSRMIEEWQERERGPDERERVEKINNVWDSEQSSKVINYTF